MLKSRIIEFFKKFKNKFPTSNQYVLSTFKKSGSELIIRIENTQDSNKIHDFTIQTPKTIIDELLVENIQYKFPPDCSKKPFVVHESKYSYTIPEDLVEKIRNLLPNTCLLYRAYPVRAKLQSAYCFQVLNTAYGYNIYIAPGDDIDFKKEITLTSELNKFIKDFSYETYAFKLDDLRKFNLTGDSYRQLLRHVSTTIETHNFEE